MSVLRTICGLTIGDRSREVDLLKSLDIDRHCSSGTQHRFM